jgi:arylsulfatase A-like enzyme
MFAEMKRFCFVALCLAGLNLISGCKGNRGQTDTVPPNIIFLMDDQHRWDALGIVDPAVITPHLDRLARQGIFFDQAVCQAPMCIASRNSMMMGLYPNQIGILRNEPGIRDEDLPAKTLAQAFREAGYETAGFGKTHWGLTCSTRGFETRYASEVMEYGAVMMKDTDPEKKKLYDEETVEYGPGEEDPSGYVGRTSGIPEAVHRDGWVTGKCLEYLKRRDDDRPLFLYLSFMKPHAGHNVPEGFEGLYDLDKVAYAEQPPWDKDHSPHAEGINRRDMYVDYWKNATEEDWKLMTMRYRANCSWMDDMFGRVLQVLGERGMLENALIVYVSDHGEMLGERYYRFNKYCLYESAVRVPVILSGTALPEEFRGRIDRRPAELIDVYPTLLKAAGIEVPQTAEGRDLLSRDELRQASFCALHERPGEASFMWRTREMKLILCFERKAEASSYTASDILGGELYDLAKDPVEWNDLFGDEDYRDMQEKMSEELMSHIRTLQHMSPIN